MKLYLSISIISIHAPLTGSDREQCQGHVVHRISIHAPLTGSDLSDQPPAAMTPISIHAPLTGSDQDHKKSRLASEQFQSTLPSQGATADRGRYFIEGLFQSTLPSQGATATSFVVIRTNIISIHAPLTGSDDQTNYTDNLPRLFQSTLPSQGATYHCY